MYFPYLISNDSHFILLLLCLWFYGNICVMFVLLGFGEITIWKMIVFYLLEPAETFIAESVNLMTFDMNMHAFKE